MRSGQAMILAALSFVVLAAGGACVWGQMQASSQPAGHHSSMKDMSDAIAAIDAATKTLETGGPAVSDVEKAHMAVKKTIEGVKSCKAMMAGGKSAGTATQPSPTAAMHEGFIKQLQDAIKMLDSAKSAAGKSDKVKALADLKSAKEQVNAVLASFGGHRATSMPAK